jgi:hypothetical protein
LNQFLKMLRPNSLVRYYTTWLGYKVHLTETCEKNKVHLITNVQTTLAHLSDVDQTELIHQSLADKELLPSQHIVDAGYVDGQILTINVLELKGQFLKLFAVLSCVLLAIRVWIKFIYNTYLLRLR